tara:strand:- start:2043 stop:2303 length:261 start_codon:yes stop_codon:yes gene_type:complete
VYKVTITRVSEYELYVDSDEMEFAEWAALERAHRYPEEWKDIDTLVDLEEADPENLDKNISFGINPRVKVEEEDNLDTGGYGKQSL